MYIPGVGFWTVVCIHFFFEKNEKPQSFCIFLFFTRCLSIVLSCSLPLKVYWYGGLALDNKHSVIPVVLGDNHFHTIACDETTLTQKFSFDCAMIAILDFIDKHTRFGFAGDPCQNTNHASLPTNIGQILQNTNASAPLMKWVMDKIIEVDPPAEVLVQSVHLLNRQGPSLRCPGKIADFVSVMAPLCLPGQKEFWSRPVESKPVWADLGRRITSADTTCALLDTHMPQIVTYEPLQLSDDNSKKAKGVIGTSDYDLNIALMASAAAIRIGLYEISLRNGGTGVPGDFEDKQQFTAWTDASVSIQCIAIYQSMTLVMQVCVKFLINLSTKMTKQQKAQLLIAFSTADKMQGSTKATTVLAYNPDGTKWSSFAGAPKRMVTMFSRSFRTIVMPQSPTNANAPFKRQKTSVTSQIVKALSDLDHHADFNISWADIRGILGIEVSADEIWNRWYAHVQPFVRTPTVGKNYFDSLVTEVRKKEQSRPSALLFCGSSLTFLRSLSCFLQNAQESTDIAVPFSSVEDYMYQTLDDHRVETSGKSPSTVLARVVNWKQKKWFEHTFLDFVRSRFVCKPSAPGRLYSVVEKPVNDDPSLRIYSALVYGLGRAKWCESAMGRMEWLAFESIMALKKQLNDKDRTFWTQFLQLQLRADDRVEFDIGFGPHKMEYDGLEMQSTMAGANDRADFFLICRNSNSGIGRILCTVYHTTNFSENTLSKRSDIFIFESRLLFRGCPMLCDMMDTVIQKYGFVVGREPCASCIALCVCYYTLRLLSMIRDLLKRFKSTTARLVHVFCFYQATSHPNF